MAFLRTLFWSLPLLCWAVVFIAETRPAFGLPHWVFALFILSFWLMVACKLHALHKSEQSA